MMSVPNPSDVQATYVATLVDEWIRCGLSDVVICPGSRSTPMTLELARRKELRISVRLDERGAAFYALGRSLETTRPALIIVTSGTAAAELHAAVAEADQAYVPLLVVTADRPPELHGVGAPQTIPQHDLFGPMVRLAADPGVATESAAGTWRSLARDLWHAAIGTLAPAGPVHLNAAFIEPLLGQPCTLEATATLPVDPSLPASIEVTPDVAGQRVLAVFGPGAQRRDFERARAMNWAVLGDATATNTISYFDGLLRNDDFAKLVRPDVVVRLGGLVASKTLASRIREWHVPVIGLALSRPVADPDRVVTATLRGTDLVVSPVGQADATYCDIWLTAARRAEENFAGLALSSSKLTEAVIAREVVRETNEYDRPLVLGSSMPIREVEWFTPARKGHVFSNRGANGIDGVTSTVFGIGAVRGAVGLIGDLTFLHDASALVDPPQAPVAVVVVANDGGHIFDFLPQKAALATDEFAELFTTPRIPRPSDVARGFGLKAVVVETVGELRAALRDSANQADVTVIEAVPSAPVTNVEFHAWLERSLSRIANETVQSQ